MAAPPQPSSYEGLWRAVRDPRLITLVLAVMLIAGIVVWWGRVLLPFIIALVLAYFLEGGVQQIVRWGIRRRWAVAIVYTAFVLVYLGGILGPLQLIVRQTLNLMRNGPEMIAMIKEAVQAQAGTLLAVFPESQQAEVVNWLTNRMHEWGDAAARAIMPAFGQATMWAVTLLLVPLLVFFLLVDKEEMVAQFRRLLPNDIELVADIWEEMERKLANYVRGKMWEIIIVTIVTTFVFRLLGFQYAFLMGLATGVSVLIPYVGMIAVAIPLTFLGLIQWGVTWDFGVLLIAYTVIQFIDANILVPYIFSEAVKMSPFYILLAAFVFGAIWGLWGVFLAIPLATLASTIVSTLIEFREELLNEAKSGGPPPPIA